MGQNPTEQQLNSMVEKADKDGDGLIDFDEFISMIADNLKLVESSSFA